MTVLPRIDCVLMVVGSGVSTQNEVEEGMSRLSKATSAGRGAEQGRGACPKRLLLAWPPDRRWCVDSGYSIRIAVSHSFLRLSFRPATPCHGGVCRGSVLAPDGFTVMAEHLRALVVLMILGVGYFYAARGALSQLLAEETFKRWRNLVAGGDGCAVPLAQHLAVLPDARCHFAGLSAP